MEITAGFSLNVTVLSWAFLVTNSMRILAYLPTIKKLLRTEVTADCQSQLKWLLGRYPISRLRCICSNPIIAK
jgi:hypothetical protein